MFEEEQARIWNCSNEIRSYEILKHSIKPFVKNVRKKEFLNHERYMIILFDKEYTDWAVYQKELEKNEIGDFHFSYKRGENKFGKLYVKNPILNPTLVKVFKRKNN